MIVCGIRYQWRDGPQQKTVVFQEENGEKSLSVRSPGSRSPPSTLKWDTEVYRERDVYQNIIEIPCLRIQSGAKTYFFVLREGIWYQSVDINPYCTVMYMMEPNTLSIPENN